MNPALIPPGLISKTFANPECLWVCDGFSIRYRDATNAEWSRFLSDKTMPVDGELWLFRGDPVVMLEVKTSDQEWQKVLRQHCEQLQ